MSGPTPNEVSKLLVRWRNGDKTALGELTPLVYEELRRLARHYMRGERINHTLQPTALVNEAYTRMVDLRDIHWQNKAHFFAVAATLMRRILVDHARSRNYAKRGGNTARVTLDDASPGKSRETSKFSPSTRHWSRWRRSISAKFEWSNCGTSAG